jgi:hypothetical protein
VLRWAHAYGYFLDPEQDAVKRGLFDDLQSQADRWLERLHGCAELERKELFGAINGESTMASEMFRVYREKLANLTRVTCKFLRNLVKAIETDMPEVVKPATLVPKYVKIWEGTLSGQRQGQPVFICKLEAYRRETASQTLALNWPENLQIIRLIAEEHMKNKQYAGKADVLVFRTFNQHGFLQQIKEKKLCAVITLPSQTLLLSMSDRTGRMIGMLFAGDIVVFKPQVSTQQPPME